MSCELNDWVFWAVIDRQTLKWSVKFTILTYIITLVQVLAYHFERFCLFKRNGVGSFSHKFFFSVELEL